MPVSLYCHTYSFGEAAGRLPAAFPRYWRWRPESCGHRGKFSGKSCAENKNVVACNQKRICCRRRDPGCLTCRILFPIVFFMVLWTFIMTIAKGLSTWNKNNHSPRLTVEAAVTAKRIHVTHHRHANAGDVSGPTALRTRPPRSICHLPGGSGDGGAFPFPGRNTGC